MAPKLPKLPPYKTSEKTKLAISAALSMQFNPRNIESAWNAPYGLVLHDLTSGFDDLIPQIQYTQWRAEEGVFTRLNHALWTPLHTESGSEKDEGDSEVELNDQADDNPNILDSVSVLSAESLVGDAHHPDSEVDLDDQADNNLDIRVTISKLSTESLADNDVHDHPDSEVDDLDDQADDDANILDVSTLSAESLAGNDAHHPDLAILHTCKELMDQPVEDFTIQSTLKRAQRLKKEQIHLQQRFGHQIFHQCPIMLGEMKRNVSRTEILEILSTPGASDEEMHKERVALVDINLRMARNDMKDYLRIFFEKYPRIDTVLAFVSAGPYWQATEMRKDDVPDVGDTALFSPDASKIHAAYVRKYGHIYELGQSDSDKRLTHWKKRVLARISTHA